MEIKRVKEKDLIKSKLLKEYASWIYCGECNNTVGYLCYTTYTLFKYEFECKCGNKGVVKISLEESNDTYESYVPLKLVKHRFRCPNDDSPLFSVVDRNVNYYRYSLICRECNSFFKGSQSNQ